MGGGGVKLGRGDTVRVRAGCGGWLGLGPDIRVGLGLGPVIRVGLS